MNSQQLVVEPVPAQSIETVIRFLSQGIGIGAIDGEFVWARKGEQIVTVAGVGRPAGRIVDVVLSDTTDRLSPVEGKAVMTAVEGMIGRTRDLHLAQALIPTHGGYWDDLLLSCDFMQTATIEVLAALPKVCDADKSISFAKSGEQPELGEVIKATWQDSLDCADLEDNRTIDDVLAEYDSRCHGDRDHWYLIRSQGQSIGCVILNATAIGGMDDGPMETVYWGLVPSYRGRGLGDEVLRFVRRTAALHTRMVTAAVDQKNTPAMAVYLRNGFQSVDTRRLYVKYL